MKGIVLLMVVVLQLAGCAGNNFYGPERARVSDLSSGKGWVIVSTGASRPCYSHDVFLKLLPEGTPFSATSISNLNVDAPNFKSDFSDHVGNIHVLSLAPGHYYLAPGVLQRLAFQINVPKMKFLVEAGKIYYLGEFSLSQACTQDTSGVINDRMDRDLEIVRLKNPNIDTSKVEKRLMAISGFIE